MFLLRSSAFDPDAPIPARHTCDGADLSPPLAWSGSPAGTRSFALIVDDPDAPDPAAPTRTWVHWLLYNIPADAAGLPEGAGNGEPARPGLHARTDAGSHGYHGPCPPIGRHRYYFRLAALDTDLPPLAPGAGRAELERAMAGHRLATAVLMGSYARARG
ncbi:MAG TPA: YbhB/YbcL family Raf kinase inhibitor-like protein [Gemmatimonadales bacterium]|nr:YbhB/YbcL family Raf kinase inhibitor-like protein [Gemmatimonadales bacterium]